MDLLILSFGELSETNMVRIDMRGIGFREDTSLEQISVQDKHLQRTYFMYLFIYLFYVSHCLFDVFPLSYTILKHVGLARDLIYIKRS